jgi:hypothetical protein
MDFGRSFVYISEDEDWIKKVALAGLISLIPFVGQIYLMGYLFQVLKNIIEGREVPLPEVTDDLGGKLLSGLLLSVITVIYYLPVSLISAFSGIGNALLIQAAQDSQTVSTLSAVWAGCFGCLSFVFGVAASLLIPFVWSKYAETGEFGAAFKLGEFFAMFKENLGPTILVVLISGVLSAVAVLVGLAVCFIGVIFTTLYAQLVTVFLYGSLYRQARKAAA